MIKNSFSLRVLVISFLLIALPLLVNSFIFFQDSYYDSIDDAKRELRIETSYRTLTLMELQPVKQVLLKELIYILDLKVNLENPDPNKLNKQLKEVVDLNGEFQLFIMAIEDHSLYKIIASSQSDVVGTYFLSYRQLQEVVKNGEGTFIRYIRDRNTGQYMPYVFLANVIVSEKTGKPIGIIMATSNIQTQLKTLLTPFDPSSTTQFAILNTDGVVFAATDPQLEGNFFEPISEARRTEIIETGQIGKQQLASEPLPVIQGENPPFFEFIFNDQVQIAYRSTVPTVGISVMSYSGKEVFFGTAVRHFLFIYTIYGLILIIGGGVTYWLSLWISRPLTQLSHLMVQVSQGNRHVRFKEAPLGFEINILGRMFNHTIDTLLENIQRAEDERVQKEIYQRELAIGRRVQRNLLPHQLPVIKGAELAGIYLPADDVGGDFYGYLTKKTQTGEEVLVLTVADAAGRGISSCLYSFSLRGLFRAHATLSDDVGEILSLSNNAFIRDSGDTGMYMTLFYGMYHTESKILKYYSCGHVPGFVKRSDGQLITLACSGIAVGLKEEANLYHTDSFQLMSGDVIVLYTDGLIEAVDANGKQFSSERLKEHLLKKQWTSAQEIVDSLSAEVQAHMRSVSQAEETIIVALKVH